MELTFTNKAMQPMSGFAIQFNKNRWVLPHPQVCRGQGLVCPPVLSSLVECCHTSWWVIILVVHRIGMMRISALPVISSCMVLQFKAGFVRTLMGVYFWIMASAALWYLSLGALKKNQQQTVVVMLVQSSIDSWMNSRDWYWKRQNCGLLWNKSVVNRAYLRCTIHFLVAWKLRI